MILQRLKKVGMPLVIFQIFKTTLTDGVSSEQARGISPHVQREQRVTGVCDHLPSTRLDTPQAKYNILFLAFRDKFLTNKFQKLYLSSVQAALKLLTSQRFLERC